MLYLSLARGGEVVPPLRVLGEAAPPPQRLVGPEAASVVLDALEGSPMPAGLAGQRAVLRGRRVAFKTGTSFGFRDAWSMGVSADYTVAVWIGRPDGGAMPGALGLNLAAPLLFRVFERLPPEASARARGLDSRHALLQRQPPPALARLERSPVVAGGPARPTPLRLLYPPDGAVIEPLTYRQTLGVALRATGGTPPLRWVVNELPLADERGQMPASSGGDRLWTGVESGFAEIVVLDAAGQSARSRGRIELPSTSPRTSP